MTEGFVVKTKSSILEENAVMRVGSWITWVKLKSLIIFKKRLPSAERQLAVPSPPFHVISGKLKSPMTNIWGIWQELHANSHGSFRESLRSSEADGSKHTKSLPDSQSERTRIQVQVENMWKQYEREIYLISRWEHRPLFLLFGQICKTCKRFCNVKAQCREFFWQPSFC